MQSLKLARIAADAERLRLKRHVRRLVMRAMFGAIACVFLLCALTSAHVVGYIALRLRLAPLQAGLVVLGVDLVLAILLGLLAMRGGEDALEREARAVRDRALGELRDRTAMFALIAPLARILGKRGVYGGFLAALTARFLSTR